MSKIRINGMTKRALLAEYGEIPEPLEPKKRSAKKQSSVVATESAPKQDPMGLKSSENRSYEKDRLVSLFEGCGSFADHFTINTLTPIISHEEETTGKSAVLRQIRKAYYVNVEELIELPTRKEKNAKQRVPSASSEESVNPYVEYAKQVVSEIIKESSSSSNSSPLLSNSNWNIDSTMPDVPENRLRVSIERHTHGWESWDVQECQMRWNELRPFYEWLEYVPDDLRPRLYEIERRAKSISVSIRDVGWSVSSSETKPPESEKDRLMKRLFNNIRKDIDNDRFDYELVMRAVRSALINDIEHGYQWVAIFIFFQQIKVMKTQYTFTDFAQLMNMEFPHFRLKCKSSQFNEYYHKKSSSLKETNKKKSIMYLANLMVDSYEDLKEKQQAINQ